MRRITIKGTVENITNCVPLVEDSIEENDLIGLPEYYSNSADSTPKTVSNGTHENVKSDS